MTPTIQLTKLKSLSVSVAKKTWFRIGESNALTADHLTKIGNASYHMSWNIAF